MCGSMFECLEKNVSYLLKVVFHINSQHECVDVSLGHFVSSL